VLRCCGGEPWPQPALIAPGHLREPDRFPIDRRDFWREEQA